MGPLPRSFRCDAYHCIMVWVSAPTEYKDVARNLRAPHAGSPRTSSSRPQQVCRRARSHQGQACWWPPNGAASL